ncbi:putative baseplate assembly protein [Micromonospora echinofusca]|uniref:Baseplate assembly protein n=1 Tax=Micromonospora echinofusca TaxID=47858 RepID=A0ABS3VZL0_MICEH|nr:putative baseplate assembly protein [Micromonospora echinofusca]MBO4209975.1 putative baseplate assembly protein [Micromonospora echinofusca]
MALIPPNLDDRRFQDLVDDAKRMVQQRCPEWTDHNVSDPGVTLIETFAYLVDQLLYRLNRVPDRHYVKFLDLIGVTPFAPSVASTEVTFWLSAPRDVPVVVPAGTHVATVRAENVEPVTFETVRELTVPPCELVAVATVTAGGEQADRTGDLGGPERIAAFADPPAPGDAVLFGLDRPVPGCAVLLTMDWVVAGRGVDPTNAPLVWEAWTDGGWVPCPEERNTTGALNRAGEVVLHVPAGLDRAYLFSLPRDLVVDIPAFPAAGFPGQRTKLTHAMSYGSRVPGRRGTPDPAQGYQLLATTVSRYTGIDRFDGGAMLTFGGFDNLVDAIGGVDLTIDQRVVSRHRQPDGKHRRAVPGGYAGPQMVYQPGPAHLNGWQAIDYARQRYLTGGDYARQRHQQQLVKAMVRQIQGADLARDPGRVDAIVRSLGRAMTFVGDGYRLVDVAYALGGLRPDALTLVGLPGRSVGSGAGYRGEQLDPVGRRFLTELRAGRVEAFLTANPKLVLKG